MNYRLLSALACATVASAFLEPIQHDFRKPGPLDSRSPCPGLNALANHGYLPRDGKNLDNAMIDEAARTAYGFAPGFFQSVVDQVFQFNISTTDRPSETFHLVDLARHDTIEVDGSLTRNDIYFGDDLHFDATVWNPVAKDLGLDEFPLLGRVVTVETAASATKNRLQLAKRVNPKFSASPQQHLNEYGTTALYLLTLRDEGKGGAAPKAWVKTLMSEDRIPYREGYNKGKNDKSLEQIGSLLTALRNTVGWTPNSA